MTSSRAATVPGVIPETAGAGRAEVGPVPPSASRNQRGSRRLSAVVSASIRAYCGFSQSGQRAGTVACRDRRRPSLLDWVEIRRVRAVGFMVVFAVLSSGCGSSDQTPTERLAALDDETEIAFAIPALLPDSFVLASPLGVNSNSDGDLVVDIQFVDSSTPPAPRRIGVCTVGAQGSRDACVPPEIGVPSPSRVLGGVTAYVYAMTPDTVDRATLQSFAALLTLDWRSASWVAGEP